MTDLNMTRQFGDANPKHEQALANIARAMQGEGNLLKEALRSLTSLPLELGYSKPYSAL